MNKHYRSTPEVEETLRAIQKAHGLANASETIRYLVAAVAPAVIGHPIEYKLTPGRAPKPTDRDLRDGGFALFGASAELRELMNDWRTTGSQPSAAALALARAEAVTPHQQAVLQACWAAWL